MDIENELFNAQVESEVQKRIKGELERIVNDPDAVIAAYSKKLEMQRRELEVLRPKAEFADVVMQSDDWSEMAAVAKLIGYKGRGRNTIFDILRERKILRANNEPYQRYVEPGYFKVVEQHWENRKTGETMVNKKTVVSQRGIDFIRRILNEVDA